VKPRPSLRATTATVRRSGRRLGRILVQAMLLAMLASVAGAQSGLRVTHQVGQTAPTHVEVVGTVANETRADAVDVSVTVEALGPGGKRLARGIVHVASRLPAGTTAPFTAKVPAVAGVTGYRASASSFRFVPGAESP
jgi:hypothetical protein